MKLRNIMQEKSRIPGIPVTFKKLFADFPRDATSWSQATDEILEVLKIIRETYNDLESKNIQPLNFRNFETPSEWNSNASVQIVIIWNKMKPETRKAALEQLKNNFPRYF